MSNFKGYLKDKDGNKIYPDDYDTGWVNLSLESDFTQVSSSSYPVSYRKVGNVVYLKGLVTRNGSSTGNTITYLPYIPTQTLTFTVASRLSEAIYGNKAMMIRINTYGELHLNGDNISSSDWIALDGVSYFVD